MELLQLSYFQALAKNGNLTHTAKELYISPPSLSASISRLEKELGVSLFDRVGNKIVLNKSGALFLSYVDEILSDLNTAVAVLRENNHIETEGLRIAHSSVSLMSKLMINYMTHCPSVSVSEMSMSLDDLRQGVDLLNRYDILLACPDDLDATGLNHVTLYNDDYIVLMVPASHPFAKRKSVSLSELTDEKFVALTKDFSARKLYDQICRDAGFEPKISIECDYSMRSTMVSKGMGIAMCTRRVTDLGPQKTVKYIRIKEKAIARKQEIFWNPKRHLSKAAKDFIDLSVNLFKEEND